MIDQALLAEAHRLALTIAPELSRQPLYIMERPECIAKPVNVTAWADKYGATIPIKKHLESIGKWFGDGPEIVLNRPFESMRKLAKIIVHETAHLLPAVPCVSFHCEPPALENFQKEMHAQWAADPFPVQDRTGPWAGDHGAKFCRRVLHLHARARCAGYRMDVEDVYDGRGYGLSSTLRYATALDDELDELAGANFTEIEAAPMPTKFRRLFIADATSYFQN